MSDTRKTFSSINAIVIFVEITVYDRFQICLASGRFYFQIKVGICSRTDAILMGAGNPFFPGKGIKFKLE